MEEGMAMDTAISLTPTAGVSYGVEYSASHAKSENTINAVQTMPDEEVMALSRRIMAQNKWVYEMLAK